MKNPEQPHPFIAYLQSLTERESRGSLAALRRGLGQPPGATADMYPYIIPWLPQEATPNQESAYYLVASLFAYHPVSCDNGNLGTHLAQTQKADENVDALERRFIALLSTHPEDLPDYLRQAISYLKSKDETPVNWNQLFRDLQNWGRPDRRVQKAWAQAFWSRRNIPAESTQTAPDQPTIL